MPSFKKSKYVLNSNPYLQVEPQEKNAAASDSTNDEEQSQCDSPLGSLESLVFDDQVSDHRFYVCMFNICLKRSWSWNGDIFFL